MTPVTLVTPDTPVSVYKSGGGGSLCPLTIKGEGDEAPPALPPPASAAYVKIINFRIFLVLIS